MRTVQTDTERNALAPNDVNELISQNGTLYISTGLVPGSWRLASDLPLGKTVVTVVDVTSTNLQLPTAKAVWDAIQLAVAP